MGEVGDLGERKTDRFVILDLDCEAGVLDLGGFLRVP